MLLQFYAVPLLLSLLVLSIFQYKTEKKHFYITEKSTKNNTNFFGKAMRQFY